jgi:hypothetical protein
VEPAILNVAYPFNSKPMPFLKRASRITFGVSEELVGLLEQREAEIAA